MKATLGWVLASVWLVGGLSVQAKEKLAIKGSNTFGEELGPQLISAFQKQNSAVEITLGSQGSASGIAALLEGTCDIASASRALTEDEQRLARSRSIQLKPSAIGYYGVAVVANDQNPLHNLSDRDVRDIFTGKKTNWKQVGGPDRPIEVLIRDDTGGTHLGFQELAMERKPYAASARGFASYTALADEIAAKPDAIGYVGMNLVAHPGIHALTINGTPPNDIAVNEGLYPYVRTVWLYTRETPAHKTADRFIRFVRSKAGQQIVTAVGFVSINQPRLSEPTGP